MPTFTKIKYEKVPSLDACTLLHMKYNIAKATGSGDAHEIFDKAYGQGCEWASYPLPTPGKGWPPDYKIKDPSWPEPDPHGPWWLGGVYDVEIVKDPV